MKLSEKLRIVAEWLESEENDLIVSADLGPRGRDVASAQANPLAGVARVLGNALYAWQTKNNSEAAQTYIAQCFDGSPPFMLGSPTDVQKLAREVAANKQFGTDPAVNKAATDLWQAAANLAKQQAQIPAPKTASEEDRVLSIVAEALVSAADIIRTASEYVASEEPAVELPSSDELDEIAAVAAAFDESEDEMLQKQAGILDNILAVLSSVDLASNVYDEDARLEEVKKKYHDVRDKLHEDGGLDAAAEAVEKSPVMKEKRKVQYLSLKSRYCPDHAGISTIRVAENRVQCPLDHKMYDYANGYSLLDGTKVPGGDVANQGDNFVHNEGHLIFQNRNDRLGQPDK